MPHRASRSDSLSLQVKCRDCYRINLGQCRYYNQKASSTRQSLPENKSKIELTTQHNNSWGVFHVMECAMECAMEWWNNITQRTIL
eukprot:scaffold1110_cov182-Ochromonas_danica.AAC.13